MKIRFRALKVSNFHFTFQNLFPEEILSRSASVFKNALSGKAVYPLPLVYIASYHPVGRVGRVRVGVLFDVRAVARAAMAYELVVA